MKKNDTYIIGLDCSTTSTKAIAFDRNGKIIARASESIPLYSSKPNYYEQNENDWWSSAQTSLKKITQKIDPQKISALAISNQRETFVALDKHGKSLRPAIIWLDERCKDEVESFSKKVGKKRIHKITGKPADYAPVVYRLAWMKKHEPKLFKKISMICDVQTYLVWKLIGAFKTSWASADPLGMFDLENKKWSAFILNELGLKDNQFPETFCSGTVLGKISETVSIKTGLTTETLVIAGGGDGQAAGLGSHVLKSNRAYLNLGTAAVAGVYNTKYQIDKSFRTMSSCSDKGYCFECSLRAGTFSIDWLIKNILKIDPAKQKNIYRELQSEAENISAGSDGVLYLPYLCGVMNPYWDINARGAFVGLSASHTRAQLYRSILEGIAFEQLFVLNSVEKLTRKKIKEIVAIGGGAASNLWCKIIADITGKKVLIPYTGEASALGAAIIASVGIGWHASFSAAAGKMTGIEKIIIPDKVNRRKYKMVFEEYKKIYPALRILRHI
jgi:sugar (pentulose or hexulose) kinase